MPARSVTALGSRKFDARPDRIDFRDLPYRAPLVTLPPQYPSDKDISEYFHIYCRMGMLLNQGNEGACTGYGLAGVVNYLRWEEWVTRTADSSKKRQIKNAPARVSPRMLYQNARLYDEWRGDDYEGSSCRGAMKGFHKHGVCSEELWPAFSKGNKPGHAQDGWDLDAARCPLGAYYRLDAKSLVDMQAAIFETHAIYVSATVHDGWQLGKYKSLDSARIKPRKSKEVGGHAFCLVGYTPDGFIVQNSWGPNWGFNGFAVLPYEDWTANGDDAWAVALGAAMRIARSPSARTSLALDERRSLKAPVFVSAAADDSTVKPWIHGEESSHILLIGHGGRAIRDLVSANDGEDNVRRVMLDGVTEAVKRGISKVAIYAHGGLNDMESGIQRARVMGPWLAANGIYPIFIVWQTGFLESAGDIIRIGMEKLGLLEPPQRVEGWLIDRLESVKDRAFEVFSRDFGVKAIWDNMKDRANAANAGSGGLDLAAKFLADALGAAGTNPTIHLLGHSAGAIMHGNFLSAMKRYRLEAKSLHLWAPACTVAFANDKLGSAFADKTVLPGNTFVTLLSDENEKSDPCVPVAYSKSLLYLVSRALEPDHKTPILGMQKAWPKWRKDDEDIFGRETRDQLDQWKKIGSQIVIDPPIQAHEVFARREKKTSATIVANHGSFDNNVDVVNSAIARILGKSKPTIAVTDLRGF